MNEADKSIPLVSASAIRELQTLHMKTSCVKSRDVTMSIFQVTIIVRKIITIPRLPRLFTF